MLKKKMIQSVLFVSVLLLLVSSVVLGAAASDLTQAKENYIQVRDLYYNNGLPSSQIKIKIGEEQKLVQELVDGYDKYYLLAQVEYLLGNIAIDEKNEKAAEQYFTQSQKMILKALDYNENASDAKRILGDTYLNLMNYKNFFYQIRHGGKLKKLPSEAIVLNPKNWAAHISLGIFYTNAPKAAGGNVQEGIKEFKIALQSDDYYWQYMAYGMLGEAYSMLDDKEQARLFYNKALEIYPGNTWVANKLKELH